MIVEGNAAFIPDAEFKEKIQQALDLLKTSAGANFAFLSANVRKIVAEEKTAANVHYSKIEIGKPTFDASLQWLSSVLVHESCHIALHQAKKDWHGTEAEQECNRMQLETLRLIGASEHEITYLLAQKGDHFDQNGDGKFNRRDSKLQQH